MAQRRKRFERSMSLTINYRVTLKIHEHSFFNVENAAVAEKY
jgi:hypothetical protein